MIRIYGCKDQRARSLINRFVESAGTKLPMDLRIVVDYHRRRRSGIVELRGWKVYRTGSRSLICDVDFQLNDVTWLKRGKKLKTDFLSDYVGFYAVDEYLQYPEEKEGE